MRADKTAAEMDKQLNKCDASEPLRTKAILVLRLLMRARGACVIHFTWPRNDALCTGDDGLRKRQLSCEEGVKIIVVALDKFVALYSYTYIGQEPVEEMVLAALTFFKSWTILNRKIKSVDYE